MAKRTEIAKQPATKLQPAINGFLVIVNDEYARFAGMFIRHLRRIAGKEPLDVEQLKDEATGWAYELIEAGIPPRLWKEIVWLAREARPSSNKAFMVVIEQVIDAWQHYLRGHRWNFDKGAWEPAPIPTTYCGKCKDGLIFEKRMIKRQGRAETREGWFECDCRIAPAARNTYHFRRFAAAYEILTGREYEPTATDLKTLYYRESEIDYSLWDSEMRKYFAETDAPTIEGLCGRLPMI